MSVSILMVGVGLAIDGRRMLCLGIFDLVRINGMMIVARICMIMIDCLVNFYGLAKIEHSTLFRYEFYCINFKSKCIFKGKNRYFKNN